MCPLGVNSGEQRPPRVIVVMNARWPRALLRAALREAGYDALGAATLSFALRYPATDRERGAVRLIVIDADARPSTSASVLDELVEKHGRPATLLVASAGRPQPAGNWTKVLRRPISIGELVAAVRGLLPLPPGMRRPLTG